MRGGSVVVVFGLGIGLIPAGILLLVAGRVFRKRLGDPDLVTWSGIIALILAAVLLLIVSLWK
jgi:putative Ca2+/H+ antiporter (TMEM165/GDT1 family)